MADFKDVLKAIEIIKKENAKSGTIECPVCKKKLSYQIHSNGHIWGKCETKDCLGWMM